MIKVIHFDELESTSTYLKQNYDKHENLTFVSTDYQKSGHGRNNKKWISNSKENLLFSILIKDKEVIKNYSSLSLASAVCIYEVLKQLNINNVSIKWPNDVFINDKKIAGILLESISFSNNIEALVIGIGLNVNSMNFSEDLQNIATSIYLEKKEKQSLEELKKMVYEKFIEMIKNIKIDNKDYLNIVRNNNYLKNKIINIEKNNEILEAEVIDINEDNSLKTKTNNIILNVDSGEVTIKKDFNGY